MKQKNRPMSKEERTRRYEEGLASGELVLDMKWDNGREVWIDRDGHAYEASRFGIGSWSHRSEVA
jgi:hypothetical protein